MHSQRSTASRFARLSLVALITAAPSPLLAEPPATPPATPATPATPAPADLPSAQSIIDRFIEVTGGRAAYEKITNRVTTGKFEIPAAGLSAKLRSIQAAPDKTRIFIEADQIGTLDSGCNGEIAWETSQMSGPRILTGAEREQALRGAVFNAELHTSKIYTKIETVGADTTDGHTYYKVQLTPASGAPIFNFYDKDTGMLVKSHAKIVAQGGEITLETIPSDWKEVDGVKQAHVTTVKAMGMERRLVVEKIEQNVELPPDAFEPPSEVKELANPKPKTEEPAPEPKPRDPKNTPEQPK